MSMTDGQFEFIFTYKANCTNAFLFIFQSILHMRQYRQILLVRQQRSIDAERQHRLRLQHHNNKCKINWEKVDAPDCKLGLNFCANECAHLLCACVCVRLPFVECIKSKWVARQGEATFACAAREYSARSRAMRMVRSLKVQSRLNFSFFIRDFCFLNKFSFVVCKERKQHR